MKKKIIFTLTFLILLISCNKIVEPESPEKIFEKYKSSVVLIASQYYYEIYCEDFTCYYSPSSTGKLYLTKEDVLNNLSFSTGTGFIISEKGEIVTNNHVVNSKDESFRSELQDFFNVAKANLIEKVRRYNDTISTIKSAYNQYSNELDYYQKQNYQNAYDIAINEKKDLTAAFNNLDNVNLSNATSNLIIVKLGVAFNDTHITELDDLQECVVTKTSKDEKIDLAIIQTKNKSFDTKPNFILNFSDNNPNIIENPMKNKERNIKNPIKINEDVFMIGFNRGFSLANTKQGIKAQFTSGKISQQSDGERILYTIPTLEGSSGSPIIDKWGNLVGVNFAKITNSQSFSFGVPVYEVKKIYEEQ